MSRDYDLYNEKVLIIGAGAAGAMTAIKLMENNVEPLVVSKREYGDAHTTWARGGINVSLSNLDKEDNWKIHAADTLDEGHYINDPKAVENVTKNMPDVIQELDDWGMEFSLTEDGQINQRYFGAQSYRRTCFAGDYTGQELLDTLVEKAQSLGIPYKDNTFITDLISDGDKVEGAVGYDMETGKNLVFLADKVVVAAGGHTSVYGRHSSRDDENTGDGVSLAYNAGAEIMDMEFIQFHPTGMSGGRYGDEWDGRLVTEAVRGEGGRLYNEDGERFMEKYSPKQMELDARDVVARAIETEVRNGRGTENDAVYLDISHRSKDFIKDRLPRMYARFKELGVDISEEPMEVAPTAHYAMGGVKYNADTGSTRVDNLHIVGESTAGVHGANRLGGNSLAETVSIGKIVGNHLSDLDLKERESTSLEYEQKLRYIDELAERDGSVTPEEFISRIRSIMEKYCGIRRSEDRLNTGLEKIQELDHNEIYVPDEKTSVTYMRAMNARYMIDVARLIIKGAIERTESRGAHYRTDNQDKKPNWRKNIVYLRSGDDDLQRMSTPDQPSASVQEEIDNEHELDYHHLE